MMQTSALSMNLLLVGVTCLVSWLAWKQKGLMERLILWPPAIRQRHEWWRLITYGFVHADLQHLLFNMITLFFFGGVVEQLLGRLGLPGPWGYPAFYFSALLVSILPSYLRHRNNPRYASLGASGAVSAVLFAYILVQPWSLIIVFIFPMPAIVYALVYVGYSVWMARKNRDNINHGAHLWGAGFGVLFMLLLEPRVLGHFIDALLHPAF